jgi:hypothetical protein
MAVSTGGCARCLGGSVVDVMSDVLVRAAKRCLRRVLKAEWCEAHDYFVATLECGHVMHGPEEFLKSPLFCLICMREKTFGTHVIRD